MNGLGTMSLDDSLNSGGSRWWKLEGELLAHSWSAVGRNASGLFQDTINSGLFECGQARWKGAEVMGGAQEPLIMRQQRRSL